MTLIEKFHADVQRTLKHSRAESGGKYDAKKACSEVISLFLRQSTVPGSLPSSLAEYWQRTYLDVSASPDEEPTPQNIERLCALLSFLQDTHEYEETLTADDWHMLGELVNYEAEDLPLEQLQAMMGIIVSKGAL